MSLTLLHEPGPSAMLGQKSVCNGELNGFQCKRFWQYRKKVHVMNPERLRRGAAFRVCLLESNDPMDLGERGMGMAVECNMYEPSERPFDAEFDAPYAPPEDVAADGVSNAPTPNSRKMPRKKKKPAPKKAKGRKP